MVGVLQLLTQVLSLPNFYSTQAPNILQLVTPLADVDPTSDRLDFLKSPPCEIPT